MRALVRMSPPRLFIGNFSCSIIGNLSSSIRLQVCSPNTRVLGRDLKLASLGFVNTEWK